MVHPDLILAGAGACLIGSILGPWSELADRPRSGLETWQIVGDLAETLDLSALRLSGWLWLAGLVCFAFAIVFGGLRTNRWSVVVLSGIGVSAWGLICTVLFVSGHLVSPPVGPLLGLLSAVLLLTQTYLSPARDSSS